MGEGLSASVWVSSSTSSIKNYLKCVSLSLHIRKQQQWKLKHKLKQKLQKTLHEEYMKYRKAKEIRKGWIHRGVWKITRKKKYLILLCHYMSHQQKCRKKAFVVNLGLMWLWIANAQAGLVKQLNTNARQF